MRTRFLDFPWGSEVGWPLREIGVKYAGIDQLSGRYLAGTEASPSHLLYFMVQGAAECDYGQGFQVLAEGQWALCPAGGPHWIRLRKGTAEAIWVHLFATPRWACLQAQGAAFYPIQNREDIFQPFSAAMREATSDTYGAMDSATAYSSVFRVNLLREIFRVVQPDRSEVRSRFSQLWAEVHTHLDKPWTVKTLAAQMSMSESALFVQVQRLYTAKPMEMVTRLRMERAKDLLLHSDDKLEVIAQAVGYQSAFAFSDAFRRITGMRPGAYRQKVGQLG